MPLSCGNIYTLELLMGWLQAYIFPCCLPFLLLVALNPIVTPRGSSSMILRLGMGCMGLCLICYGRRNPKEREGVLVKDCKLGGRWVVWIGVAELGLDT
jgi:hypothetical protein